MVDNFLMLCKKITFSIIKLEILRNQLMLTKKLRHHDPTMLFAYCLQPKE